MTFSPFTTALLWAIPALMLAGLGLIASGIRNRNWLQHESLDQMRFDKPFSLRAGAGAVGLTFVCIALLTFIAERAGPHHSAARDTDQIAFLLEMATWVGFALIFLALSGPSQLVLNNSRRTYSWRWGAPWLPHVRMGTWDDLSGIYVSRFKGTKTGVGYTVGMRWKQGSRSCCLGKFKQREDAIQFATQTAKKLGLSRVESPPTPQLREVFKA